MLSRIATLIVRDFEMAEQIKTVFVGFLLSLSLYVFFFLSQTDYGSAIYSSGLLNIGTTAVISVGPYLGLRGNAGLDVLQWSYDPKVE